MDAKSQKVQRSLNHMRVIHRWLVCEKKVKVIVKVKVKIKFTLQQPTKTQRRARGIALLFL